MNNMESKFIDILTAADKGGWVVDDGYLLAHGMGRPVEDARVVFESQREEYRIWVRTRDWVSPQGPGRFQVVLNGVALEKMFGVGNGEWHWEDGGVVTLKESENELRLHDLTGFDGRCGGIAFEPCRSGGVENGRAASMKPPRGGESGARIERTLPGSNIHSSTSIFNINSSFSYDFVVVGGGYAGMCAAVAAARRGIKVALVQDRPVWGGNASSEVRVGPIGELGLGPFPHNSDLAYELMELTHVEGGQTSGGLRPIIDNAKLDAWLKAEKNLTCYPCTKCVDVTSIRASISSIICHRWDTGENFELKAAHFADCTGDGVLAVLAGAEYRVTPETKVETGEELAAEGTSKGGYGSTNFWTTRWTDHETTFPRCPWALDITEANWQVNRPKYFVEGEFPYAAGWNWESGFGRDVFKDAEAIRDYNLRAAYGMWDYLKNKAPDRAKYAKAEMDWLGHVLGKRAARRIVGDYILCEQDLTQHQEYPDGVVTCTWFLDLHFPHPTNAKAFPEGAFRSMAYDDPKYAELAPNGRGRQIRIRPYAIPFRCFYSRNVWNLWMAGKDISCTYVAMSSVRVENTTAQMGAMIGAAVSLCVGNGWSPRELGARHFAELATALGEGMVLSPLARKGKRRYQHRIGLKNEIKYWLRPIVQWMRKGLK